MRDPDFKWTRTINKLVNQVNKKEANQAELKLIHSLDS